MLGQEHCKALLEKGAIVYSGDINLSKSDRFINETNYRQVYLDVTSEKSIKSILKQILDQENRVDILINNAAIDSKVEKKSSLEFSRLENFSLLQWNKEIEVGLTGAFLCSKVFGSHFAQNGGGVILNIASDLSVISPDQRLYLRIKTVKKKSTCQANYLFCYKVSFSWFNKISLNLLARWKCKSKCIISWRSVFRSTI